MGMNLLNELIIIFALSIIVFIIFHKFKIPSIVGFLLTGIIAGPHGLGIIKDISKVEDLANIGVVLLLFTIGIEFSFGNLVRIKRAVLLGGTLQVFLTIAAAAFGAVLLNQTFNKAIFIGFLVCLSSTAIVLKIVQERAEIDSPHGRTTLGILIFQDIIVVPMMLLIPALAGTMEGGNQAILTLILKAIAIVLLVIVGSKWIVPPLLFQITKTKNRELFLLTIIVLCFSVAWVTYSSGLSLALGAFLAGLIIAESEYHHEALGNMIPFRDVFTSLFFISIGMLLDFNVFISKPILIILLALGVLVLKTLIGMIATILLGFPLRTAVLVGVKLGQVGEFSFILSNVGAAYGLIDNDQLQLFLSVSILTMTATPFMINWSTHISDLILKLPIPAIIKSGLYAGKEYKKEVRHDHTIIVGYGLNGQNLAKTSKDAKISYIIIEMNSQIVKLERKNGQPIFHGDATHEAVLEFAGIKNAKVIVIAISDSIATRKIVKMARRINPNVFIIVRTRYVKEVHTLYELGANDVIPEEFETSIQIFTKVLENYYIPREEIEGYIDRIRSDGYELFRHSSLPNKVEVNS